MINIIKKDKKAWIRILEAFIAIAIIFTVTIVVYSRTTKKVDREEEILKIEKIILEEIVHNDVVRDWVLKNRTAEVQGYIQTRMPVFLDFSIAICNLDEICNPVFKRDREVFVSEVVISSTLIEYNPKKLRLFAWEK